MPATVLIGTPTSHNASYTANSTSVAAAIGLMAAKGIGYGLCPVGGYDVAQQRDYIATEFLRSGCSHLLFVDSDIGFPPSLPITLLEFDKPLIGALCPLRGFNYAKLERLIKAGVPAEQALNFSHDLAALANKAKFVNGLGVVDAIGSGFLLIRREVFEKIEVKFGAPEYRLQNSPPRRRFFGWDSDASGNVTPEDWGFCLKWRSVGGEVWAFSDVEMVHVGPYEHRCNAFAAAKALSGLK